MDRPNGNLSSGLFAEDLHALLEALGIEEAMETAIPGATLAVFPTGHATAIESAQAFNRAVLDFVRRL